MGSYVRKLEDSNMKRLMTLVGIIGLLTTLNGQVRFETHETTQFGPGMVYKRIVAPKVPWSLDVVEIDLTHPAVSVETAKANDQINGYETTSSMAARKSYEGHQVLAAVNGDFYGSGGFPLILRSLKDKLSALTQPPEAILPSQKTTNRLSALFNSPGAS